MRRPARVAGRHGVVGDLQDETLQSLIRAALEENYDLRIATARILDARARVTINRSFQFPELNASAAAPYTYTTKERTPRSSSRRSRRRAGSTCSGSSISGVGSGGAPRRPATICWPRSRRAVSW
jgi:outer membrane protein TolC